MDHKIFYDLNQLKLKFKDAVSINKESYNKHWKLDDIVSNKELHDLVKDNEWERFTIILSNYQLSKNLIPTGILTNETLLTLKEKL